MVPLGGLSFFSLIKLTFFICFSLKKMFLFFLHFIPRLFFFTCVSFHFLFVISGSFHLGQVKGNARDGRSRHPPTNQSFRACEVNLATLKVATHVPKKTRELGADHENGVDWRAVEAALNLSIQPFKNTFLLPLALLCRRVASRTHTHATRGHAKKVRCLRVHAKTVNGLVLVNLVQEQARGDQLHIVAQDEEEHLHRTPEPSCKIPKRVWKTLGNPCSPLESHTTKRPSYPSRAEATASSQ